MFIKNIFGEMHKYTGIIAVYRMEEKKDEEDEEEEEEDDDEDDHPLHLFFFINFFLSIL